MNHAQSYSQAGQDLWVLSLKPNGGYFLDVGAYDGIAGSNSLTLELMGWTGTLIEAHPINFRRLLQARPNTKNINCAITDEDGVVYIKYQEDAPSSSEISEYGDPVISLTFETLFNTYKIPHHIDYMSLDIEGYEAKALSKFPFDTHICDMITVEHNLYFGDPTNKNGIMKILLNNGYILKEENIIAGRTNPSLGSGQFEDWYIHNSFKVV